MKSKELFGYSFLRKGEKVVGYESRKPFVVGFFLSLFLITISLILTYVVCVLFFFVALVNILTLIICIIGIIFPSEKTRKFVDYINSKGEIKRIYEKDFKLKEIKKEGQISFRIK